MPFVALPLVLYLLGLAVFAQATSEFMLSGLGPDIARDLGISIPAAGWLTSAFALGMIVGAPAIAVLGARWPRRRTLLTTLTVFLAVHVIGALTTSFTVLLVTRVLAALANASFLAVALATATGLVRPDAKGRATSILLGGTTLACIVGVPAGAVLGRYLGWRSAFWAVAIVSLPALIAILRSVPDRGTGPATVGAFRVRPRLAVLLLLGALVNGATFCSFTYLSPVLTEVTGFGAGWVPVMLALFGLGSFAGVTVAGRYADRRDDRLVLVAGGILLLGWCAFALTAAYDVPAVALVLVQGALSFAVGSTLISSALYAGAETPVLTGGLATAALNVGAAGGPVLGGLAIGPAGYHGPLWVSAALAGTALCVGALSVSLVHREGPW
ncbi:DHA1 family chloramphenicol resistance protein-like MFS transporter [Kribbella shirazensis]|uniref:DHA1 family chloramphenicol resistance protein-like MFS transporter n=1 Tax=Kribbella shirazensis TaxID=1105143 RepID=A0A7X5VK86_9ACTN|nr:Cmx/CmrA family chloramphenicol efflux MFS transporter [Kribbella shirazensis]NIK62401.1 DHA1 family chloramphenicol resistance protein-like MFS transporter [Kribbella shirazensis]